MASEQQGLEFDLSQPQLKKLVECAGRVVNEFEEWHDTPEQFFSAELVDALSHLWDAYETWEAESK